MKILTIDDFTLKVAGENITYYVFKKQGAPIEVMLEPCFGGYDVAVYDRGELLAEKVCTDYRGEYSQEEAREKAVAIASPLFEEHYRAYIAKRAKNSHASQKKQYGGMKGWRAEMRRRHSLRKKGGNGNGKNTA